MMMWLMWMSAAKQMQQSSPNLARSKFGAVPNREIPKTWKAYHDPEGRYVLHHPPEWKPNPKKGLSMDSAKIGSVVRVDRSTSLEDFERELLAELEPSEGKLAVKVRKADRLSGRLTVGARSFDWHSYAYPAKEGVLVLSLGNVVDAKRGKALERYEDATLSAIRRHFKVTERETDPTEI